MPITFDRPKRDKTLRERGLDFADVAKVFAGPHFTAADDRLDHGETRNITAGFLGERMVVIVWTQRGEHRYIISMRKANARERRRYTEKMG